MKWNSILCLLLLVNNSHALFNRKKKDKQERRRRLTEENGPSSSVVDDNKQQQQKQPDTSTCDGQLAQSLVKANQEIAKVQSELQQQKSTYEQQLEALKASLQEALEEKDSLVVKHEQEKTQNTTHMENYQKRVATMISEHQQEMIRLSQKRVEMEKTKDATIAELQTTLASNRDELVMSYETKLVQAQQKLEQESMVWQTKLEQKEQEYVNGLKQIKSQMEDMGGDHSAKVQTLEDKLYTQKKEFEQNMQNLAREAEKEVVKTKKDVETIWKTQIQYKDKIIKDNADLMKQHQEELEYWRLTFADRSYCNLTHIGEDMALVGAMAYDKSMDYSKKAMETISEYALLAADFVLEKSDSAWQETKKYSKQASNQSKDFYEQTVKPEYKQKVVPLVEEHVMPLVDQYVMPLLSQVDDFVKETIQPSFQALEDTITPKYQQWKALYEETHEDMAKSFGQVCVEALSIARQESAKREILQAFEETIAPQLEAICQDPSESLYRAEIGVLVMMMLPFWRVFWNLFMFVVRLVWKIVLTITPLGFFFRKSNKPKATTTKPNGSKATTKGRVKKKVSIKEKSQ